MAKDAESIVDRLRKFGTDLGLPSLNVDQLIETQRKNIDALGQAAQIAAGATESVLSKQREVLEAGLRTASEMARDYKPSGTPQEVLAKQTDFAKKAFDVAAQNARDVTGTAGKSTTEIVNIIRERLEKSLSELRAAAGSSSASAPSKSKT